MDCIWVELQESSFALEYTSFNQQFDIYKQYLFMFKVFDAPSFNIFFIHIYKMNTPHILCKMFLYLKNNPFCRVLQSSTTC